jgi:mRNA-degrading endonuclease RelE of RelBE toxin-antitoxin system
LSSSPLIAPLRKPFKGYWRARRGEYRVRYTIDETTHTVRVLDISHIADLHKGYHGSWRGKV